RRVRLYCVVVGAYPLEHFTGRLEVAWHRSGELMNRRAVSKFPRISFFFFKQKTAYDIGLGIPAEPLFRSQCLASISRWITASSSWKRFCLFVCRALSSIMVICMLTAIRLLLTFVMSLYLLLRS